MQHICEVKEGRNKIQETWRKARARVKAADRTTGSPSSMLHKFSGEVKVTSIYTRSTVDERNFRRKTQPRGTPLPPLYLKDALRSPLLRLLQTIQI